MSDQEKKLNKLCMTGFILSILSPVLLFSVTCITPFLDGTDIGVKIYGITILVSTIMPVVGLILSIIGLATARKNGRKGMGFGIAGIILPIVYVFVIIVAVGLFGFLVVVGINNDLEGRKQNELYDMGSTKIVPNTDYDVSQYRLPQGYDAGSSDITVSEADLNTFAESRLQTITREDETRIRGEYQGYDFIIIRSDCFDEWLADDATGSLSDSEDGYAVLDYEATWEFATFKDHTLDVYMDPSGEFIIITNCGDYEVISEFFG